MALVNYNVDRTDEQLNTHAPFEFQCPCRFGRIFVPEAAFLSIKIYTDENVELPVRLVHMRIDDEFLYVEFGNAKDNVLGIWKTRTSAPTGADYVYGFIYSADGILRGHVACDPGTPRLLANACRLVGGDIYSDADDFILLRQCCVPWYVGKMKRISVNGNATSGNVMLDLSLPGGHSGSLSNKLDIWSVPELDDAGGVNISINAFGDFDEAFLGRLDVESYTDSDSGLFWRYVCGKPGLLTVKVDANDDAPEGDSSYIGKYDVSAAQLLLRPTVYSNLRIVTTTDGISLMGVKAAEQADQSVSDANASALAAMTRPTPMPVTQITELEAQTAADFIRPANVKNVYRYDSSLEG